MTLFSNENICTIMSIHLMSILLNRMLNTVVDNEPCKHYALRTVCQVEGCGCEKSRGDRRPGPAAAGQIGSRREWVPEEEYERK